MLTCPQKRLASVLLLRKGFLLTFNSNNTLTLVSRETRVAHKFLYCVNGSAWAVSNPVPCIVSMHRPSSINPTTTAICIHRHDFMLRFHLWDYVLCNINLMNFLGDWKPPPHTHCPHIRPHTFMCQFMIAELRNNLLHQQEKLLGDKSQ